MRPQKKAKPDTGRAKYEPTGREKTVLNQVVVHVEAGSATPRVKVTDGKKAVMFEPDHRDEAVAYRLLAEALGTVSVDFIQGLLSQLANAGSHGPQIDEGALNFMLSVVQGVKPKDQLETMLAGTGPRTESGKRRSRRNAVRHGLTAETVIDTLEDAADYRAFERAIKSDYSPQTAIEGQLVSRLASLLWRLRRAVTVESGLLNMQAETIQSLGSRPNSESDVDRLSIFRKFLHSTDLEKSMSKQQEEKDDIGADSIGAETNQTNANIARSFLRLTNLDNKVFERLGRYETTLWRQTAQILLLLSAIEFRAKERLPDERPCFGTVRRKHGRYPTFDLNPFLRSAGRWR